MSLMKDMAVEDLGFNKDTKKYALSDLLVRMYRVSKK